MFEKSKSDLATLIKTFAQEVLEHLQPTNPTPDTGTKRSAPEPPICETTSPLNDEQWAFALTYFGYARKAAVQVAGRLGVEPQMVDDLLETAATDALIAVAKRSTDQDFVADKAKCFLMTAVFRQVRNALAKFYGWGAERPCEATLRGLVEFVSGSRFPNPVDEVIRREEEERRSSTVRRAKAVLGDLDDIRRGDGELCEWEMLKAKLRRFGLSCGGRVSELRERLAAHLRQLLGLPDLAPVQSKDVDRHALFVAAWAKGGSVREVAEALGSTVDSVKSQACHLRRKGVNLKLMPQGRRVVSRAVLAMRASAN